MARSDRQYLPDRRPRTDGWTPARQRKFLTALRATGVVRDACRAAGISSTSAYRVRRDSEAFAEAWNAAQARGLANVEEAAFKRAVLGWEEVVLREGKEVSRKKRYSDSLLQLLLKRGDLKQVRQGMSQSELELIAEQAAKAANGQFVHPRGMNSAGLRLERTLAAMAVRMVAGTVACRACGGSGRVTAETPEALAEAEAERAERVAALAALDAEAARRALAVEAAGDVAGEEALP